MSFNYLPRTMKIIILSHALDKNSNSSFLFSLKQYASVCKEFYSMLKDDLLWELVSKSFQLPFFLVKKMPFTEGDVYFWKDVIIIAKHKDIAMYDKNYVPLRSWKGKFSRKNITANYLHIQSDKDEIYRDSITKKHLVYESNCTSQIKWIIECSIGLVARLTRPKGYYVLFNGDWKFLDLPEEAHNSHRCDWYGVSYNIWESSYDDSPYDCVYIEYFVSWNLEVNSELDPMEFTGNPYWHNTSTGGPLVIMHDHHRKDLTVYNSVTGQVIYYLESIKDDNDEPCVCGELFIYGDKVYDLQTGNILFATNKKIRAITARDHGKGYVVHVKG